MRVLGREVVIVEAVRTPIGRGHREKGQFRDVHPATLLAATFTAVLDRAGVDGATVEDVLAGCVQQYGEQSFNIGRNAWLQAGLPYETPATTIDRQCGSAQQAVNFGATLIASGVHDVTIGSGVESMGRIPMFVGRQFEGVVGSPFTPELLDRYDLIDQGFSAEMIAEQWGLSRELLDGIGARSQQNAERAAAEGRFDREIVPVEVDSGLVSTDQGIRPGTTVEALAELKPVFKEDGKITAGNSSQISDGAAAVLLMSREKAKALGLRPRATIVSTCLVGSDPTMMLTAPIDATQRLFARTGLTIDDMDVTEINEAFASVVLAWARETKPDMAKVNPNGGAIALGHALGSTGAVLLTKALHELERTDGEHALVTMCCGGGLGTGTILQRI